MEGWQTVYIGSRFCHPAEQNYAPIEGEAKAASWAVDKCKFFLLGLSNFILALDHRPLISIFSDKELGSIDNPRIRSQKVKLLPYRFTPLHIPGKLHVVPDTWSRRNDNPPPSTPDNRPTDMLDINNIQPEYANHMSPPAWVSTPAILAAISSSSPGPSLMELSLGEAQLVEDEESTIAGIAVASLASIAADLQHAALSPIQVLTWQRLKEAAASSPIYCQLLSLILAGLPTTIDEWPDLLRPYYPYRHSLLVVDDLNTMLSRATQSLLWPDMKQDATTTEGYVITFILFPTWPRLMVTGGGRASTVPAWLPGYLRGNPARKGLVE